MGPLRIMEAGWGLVRISGSKRAFVRSWTPQGGLCKITRAERVGARTRTRKAPFAVQSVRCLEISRAKSGCLRIIAARGGCPSVACRIPTRNRATRASSGGRPCPAAFAPRPTRQQLQQPAPTPMKASFQSRQRQRGRGHSLLLQSAGRGAITWTRSWSFVYDAEWLVQNNPARPRPGTMRARTHAHTP